MRVVAGRFRGRNLISPQDKAVRPTSDRVRESIFNILAHGVSEFSIEGVRAIDLFAGTGALGVEAISRGAVYCLFVEEDAAARALIRQNIEALGLTGETRLFRRDATDLGEAGTMAPFDLAFLDPPYGKRLAEKSLQSLAAGGWLRPQALCVVEERAGALKSIPPGFDEIDRRSWGDTEGCFLRFSGQN